MFARATSGDKKNNNKFSPCSLHAINPVLNVKARSSKGCFTGEWSITFCVRPVALRAFKSSLFSQRVPHLYSCMFSYYTNWNVLIGGYHVMWKMERGGRRSFHLDFRNLWKVIRILELDLWGVGSLISSLRTDVSSIETGSCPINSLPDILKYITLPLKISYRSYWFYLA